MAVVEELEEEEVKEESKKPLEAAPAAATEPKVGTSTNAADLAQKLQEEEEQDPEDGFETASEGGEEESDGEESFASDEQEGMEKFGGLSVQDDTEGQIGVPSQSSVDGDVEGEGAITEKHLLNPQSREGEAGVAAEAMEEPKQSISEVPSEEQKAQLRQQGLDEAIRAKTEGNSLFAQGQYEEAVAAYQKGLLACPMGEDPEDSAVREIRSVLFSNRAACFSYKQMYQEAVEESTKALELNPNYVKALLRRSQAREKLELYEDAIVDVKKVLELDPGNTQARVSLRTLTPLAEEKREKMKEEMLAKLKEAGNSILGRFGMSVDNFKTVKDPNTGSYSIQFQR
jgi:tetratricopeptide (TPR) repeat protein